MKIAVCEDKLSDSSYLCNCIDNYCNRHCYNANVTVFETGEDLLNSFSPGAFNIIFMDILMPGLSGIHTAQKIREIDKDCIFVFITASQDFALDAFSVQALGYVTKPINGEKLESALHLCRNEFKRNSRIIEIPYNGDSLTVSIADLIYAEVLDKHTILHMKRGNIAVRLSLDEMEYLLGSAPFLRCHRSYIVNMNYIEDIRNMDFLMRNGDNVPIRKNGKKEVRLAIANFIARSPIGG